MIRKENIYVNVVHVLQTQSLLCTLDILKNVSPILDFPPIKKIIIPMKGLL